MRVIRALASAEWVVTEKIHGANVCFIVTGEDIACAKRKALLGEGDEFYGFRQVRERLRERLLELGSIAAGELPGTESVAIYGELFGGGYPHPDVAPEPDVQPIQTGVYYSPRIEFCAFDIAVDFSAEAKRERLWLDFNVFSDMCERADLFSSVPLAIGSQADALNYRVGFDSTIPGRLGLPALNGPNQAEGIVARPSKNVFIETKRGLARPLIKRKIPGFAERREYHQARPWSPRPRPSFRSPGQAYGQAGTNDDSPLDRLERQAATLLTINRARSAISKHGPVPGSGALASARQSELVSELVADVWEELKLDAPDLVDKLADDERELLHDWLEAEAAGLLQHAASAPRDC